MTFGVYFLSQQRHEWRAHYVNYAHLEKLIAGGDVAAFDEGLRAEVRHLNQFVACAFKAYQRNPGSLEHFLVFNYLALAEATKRCDQRLCRQRRRGFFRAAQTEDFYRLYLERLPRPRAARAALVILDKDGTLIAHRAMYGRWIRELAAAVAPALGLLAPPGEGSDLWAALGYCPRTGAFSRGSAVLWGTQDDVRNCLCRWALERERSPGEPPPPGRGALRAAVEARWLPARVDPTTVEPVGDVVRRCARLRERGTRVAVCTSDSRAATEAALAVLELRVDAVVCGDDALMCTPSPEPIWHLCRRTQSTPAEAVFIGDTADDIHAGINAKCGRAWGVLSGGGGREDLAAADRVFGTAAEAIGALLASAS